MDIEPDLFEQLSSIRMESDDPPIEAYFVQVKGD
jgi:hypothetical protein